MSLAASTQFSGQFDWPSGVANTTELKFSTKITSRPPSSLALSADSGQFKFTYNRVKLLEDSVNVWQAGDRKNVLVLINNKPKLIDGAYCFKPITVVDESAGGVAGIDLTLWNDQVRRQFINYKQAYNYLSCILVLFSLGSACPKSQSNCFSSAQGATNSICR